MPSTDRKCVGTKRNRVGEADGAGRWEESRTSVWARAGEPSTLSGFHQISVPILPGVMDGMQGEC